jgi:hypothetical protein
MPAIDRSKIASRLRRYSQSIKRYYNDFAARDDNDFRKDK